MNALPPVLSNPLPLLAAVTLLATLALPAADPNPAPDQPRPPGAPRPGAGPGGPQAQRFNMANRGGLPVERILNDEQREQFREELQAQRTRLREVDDKSIKLRREFEDAVFAEKLDEKLVREKAAALAELDAERALIRGRAFAKIRPSLSEEQLQRLKNLRVEFARPMGPGADFRGPRDGGLPPGEGPDRPRAPRRPPGGDADQGDPLPAPRPAPAPR